MGQLLTICLIRGFVAFALFGRTNLVRGRYVSHYNSASVDVAHPFSAEAVILRAFSPSVIPE